MSISEEQFERMLKGTIHEGKYSPPAAKPEVKRKQRPRAKRKRSETDELSDTVTKALPWMAGIRIATTPLTWIVGIFVLLTVINIIAEIFRFIVGVFN